MLAAVLKDFNNLVLEEVPTPTPGPGEVLVRIKSCGFCATDYKAIKGIRRNVTFPLIPGHEPSGVIAAVGPGVTHFKEGDEVICQPSGYCGVCEACRMGNTHYCEHAYTTGGDGPEDVRPGAFAEYMVTGEECIFRKPANVSFDAAALTEPLSGAWKGVVLKSEIHVGDDVVIIGTGGIGLLCLMVAKAAGAGRLIAIDASEYACGNAKAMGATHVIDALSGNVKEQVYSIIPKRARPRRGGGRPDHGREGDGRLAPAWHEVERIRHHHARDVRAGRRAHALPGGAHGLELRHHAARHAERDPPDGARPRGPREDHLSPFRDQGHPSDRRGHGPARPQQGDDCHVIPLGTCLTFTNVACA